ncbi:putative hydro-lyase [Paraburkholderia lacunae]|uniref:Putative hydro-lyase DLM46_32490 n=1 Tax=Paraburkholderia lacunae TaxID=2211104 RepID=A0A370MZI9_9BURK|nr:putative hydro-lyase [Paraburkholderia lacunae]RDJ98714.1 putative hydro-lyase [Paraburkholderia lacunae]
MPHTFRQQVRSKAFSGPTAGYCGDFAQANLAILPSAYAGDFMRFCLRNPKACPLLGVGEPGQFDLPMLGRDLDIRTDVPGYNVYRDGVLCEQLADIREVWRDDLVVFAIGCSFSFEQMLARERIPLRHVDEGVNVPMYRTNVANQAAGRFGGRLVVSMRPMSGAHAIRAVQITSRFPSVHGAPVHIGDPAVLGIQDLSIPDFGDPVSIHEHELPVFWACGVTPQSAIESARLPFAIAHRPGHMLITDIPNASLAVL